MKIYFNFTNHFQFILSLVEVNQAGQFQTIFLPLSYPFEYRAPKCQGCIRKYVLNCEKSCLAQNPMIHMKVESYRKLSLTFSNPSPHPSFLKNSYHPSPFPTLYFQFRLSLFPFPLSPQYYQPFLFLIFCHLWEIRLF